MATDLFAENKHKLEICSCDGHLEEVWAAAAHTITTSGIFLKQEKNVEESDQQKLNKPGVRGGPLERSETFHRFSMFMWGWQDPD